MAKRNTKLIQQVSIRTVIVLAIAYAVLNLGIAIRDNYTINTAIHKLKAEIADLEQRIEFLRNKIVYVQSTAYQELEVKRRLGLKRNGEHVVLVTSNSDPDDHTKPTVRRPSLTVDKQTITESLPFFDRASANAATWIDWLTYQ